MAADTPSPVELPFPIFRISKSTHRYMLYDVNTVSWLRKEHRIGGVLMGSLPQVPQQNVFLGLPLQLMPEEARLLVDQGLAYIVDDAESHVSTAQNIAPEYINQYVEELQLQGQEAARDSAQKRAEKSAKARAAKSVPAPRNDRLDAQKLSDEPGTAAAAGDGDGGEEPAEPSRAPTQEPRALETWAVTPSTASTLIPKPPRSDMARPQVDHPSYALFRHMHSQGYFLSPGLRFGCQFLAYPGDPLRYHSHFLSVAAEWEEPIDLLDILGGGRLGTGVKKAFIVGGPAPGEESDLHNVRTFSIEWAGM